MGADYEGQEKGIEELKALSSEAKGVLAHHLNNSLTVILGALHLDQHDLVEKAVDHIVADLELFGICKKLWR
jgi:hypothetical protein